MGCSSSSASASGPGGAKKEDDDLFQQTVVIVRHSIRVDQMIGMDVYAASEEGQRWPHDTPITEDGVKLAQTVASEMVEINKKANFAKIVCSPYRRCMQTAAHTAKALNLPVLIDQEIGEVWEKAFPSDAPPHRRGEDLKQLADELGLNVANPLLPEGEGGGYKLFGKVPQKWPEDFNDALQRFTVRVQYYIDQSASTQQNFIICSHAPAVGALTEMFERGEMNLEKLEYCARVIAERKVKKGKQEATTKEVFLANWSVETRGVEFNVNIDARNSAFEKKCEETELKAVKRKENRTRTDKLAEKAIGGGKQGKMVPTLGTFDDEEEDDDTKV